LGLLPKDTVAISKRVTSYCAFRPSASASASSTRTTNIKMGLQLGEFSRIFGKCLHNCIVTFIAHCKFTEESMNKDGPKSHALRKLLLIKSFWEVDFVGYG
jgi:hypothetical protein